MKFIGITPQKETAPKVGTVQATTPTVVGENFSAAKIQNKPLPTSSLGKKTGPIVLAMATTTTAEKKPLHKEFTLPIWGLPQTWQNIVEEVSSCKNAPRDYCVAAMVGTVASIIRKRLKLTYNEYQNYPCFWFIFVGNSSRGKSPVLNWFGKPLKDWCNIVNSEYDKSVAEWKKQGGEGTRPVPKDFVIQDMTPEARNYAMKRNNENGVLVVADEVGSFIGCIARYSGTAAKEVSDLNSVFDSSPIKIDRVDIEKRLTINEPFLNIMGGVQDDRLDKYFGNELMMDSGFNQRCMFVFPDDGPRSRNKSKISNETAEEWKSTIENLLSTMDLPMIELGLDDEATRLFDDYSDKLSDKEEEAENSYLVSLYSKHRYFVLRWAAVVAYINARDIAHENKVTGDDMRYSIECMNYFEHCALKVYNLISKQDRKQLSSPELIRQMNERFRLKEGCQHSLADCFDNLSQTAISLALNGKR
jgi:hypothetical protein